ncbi:MAG: ATP-binding protein [Elusimicrobia bacterium]|nr:ATP-binding protein [Elusimicrobiota bacterium]
MNLEQFPKWAQELADKYVSGASSLFVLYGNVDDWVPMKDVSNLPNSVGSIRPNLQRSEGLDARSLRYVSLPEFLKQAVFGTRDAVIQYDQGGGITIGSEAAQDFYRTVEAMDTVSGTTFSKRLPKNPADALLVIDRFIRSKTAGEGRKKAGIAVIISFAHMVAPRGEISFMNQEDCRTLITLQKWASDPLFARSDVTIVLATASLQELNEALVNNPFTSKIHVPLPDEEERAEFIRASQIPVKYEGLTPETFARQTNALSRADIEVMLRGAQRADRLDLNFVSAKKKELIEKSCFGLLEFLEPRYTLDAVEGLCAAKSRLREDIQLIKKGCWDALPMGYLLCGPVGTGKTFLSTCAIGELGIPCVQMLNFRSKWVGATEGNLEKILMTLRALGPVGVIIDEADAFMGSREQEGDSGTSGRIFAQFASQMGDTKYRGKILWFLLTCRPDLLPVDIKRQGRVEVHIPLFYPQTAEEKVQLFVAMSKKAKWPVEPADVDVRWVEGKKLSGADIEAVLVGAKRKSLLDGESKPGKEYLRQAAESFIPAASAAQVQYQELAAVIECTDLSFLPENYRKADRTEILKEFNRLRALLEVR